MENTEKMKTASRLWACGPALVALVSAAGMLFSCSGPQPGGQRIEIGEKGSAEAYIGQEMPIRANLAVGKEKIADIHLDIRSADAEGWTFHRHYAEGHAGRTRTLFDDRIAIPGDAKAGNYTATLLVTGENGATEEKSAEFRLSVDSSVPITGDLDVGINAAGNDLHLEAYIAAAKKIAQVRVEIEGTDWRRDFLFDKGHLKGQMTHNFHEHVHVDEAPAGEYEVRLTVEDQEGRTATATGSFRKD